MRPGSAGAGDATSVDLAVDGYKPATTARVGGGGGEEADDVWEHRIRKAGRTLTRTLTLTLTLTRTLT